MSRPSTHLLVFVCNEYFPSPFDHLNVAAFCCGETSATDQSPHMKTQQCGTEQEASHVYCISLRVWAEPVDATQKEQEHNGE